jgi:cell division protein FtsQ
MKVRRILNISGMILAFGGLLAVLGFSARETEKVRCLAIEIHVDHTDGNYFVADDDVRTIILDRGDSLIGRPLHSIDIDRYEQAIERHPHIRRAEVSSRLDGTMAVRVQQRRPVLRVFTAMGESFYMDEEGWLMPTSDNYTARVPVATGHILDSYDLIQSYNVARLNDTLAAVSLMDDLFKLTMYLRADPFWAEQIDQVEVTPQHDLVLTPLVGQHHIILGSVEQMEGKFNKLREFYTQGLPRVGWDKYSTINLKYKDQVICTKKPILNGPAQQ